MKQSFITHIQIRESRNISNLTIPLSLNEKKHLILTGKNGSGKTSLLEDINKYLRQVYQNQLKNYNQISDALKQLRSRKNELETKPFNEQVKNELNRVNRSIKSNEDFFNRFGSLDIKFSNSETLVDNVESGKFIIAYFDAKRHTKLNIPSGIKKIDFKKRYDLQERANTDFIQYIVNLKADRSFARDDNEVETVKEIDEWFEKFEKNLREIMDCQNLKLKFNRKNYNFDIIEENKKPYSFNTLSDGYSAIISIVTELLLRMEAHNVKNYNLEGIVLIDEIETHLHVDLQKKVLRFLSNFFPKIQFIVTTHSPFILSSVSNAVICDLESKFITSDLSSYSYDALIESYFSSDKYSKEVKEKLNEYEKLALSSKLSENDKERLIKLNDYFSQIPKYLSKELVVRLQQIELNKLTRKEDY